MHLQDNQAYELLIVLQPLHYAQYSVQPPTFKPVHSIEYSIQHIILPCKVQHFSLPPSQYDLSLASCTTYFLS